MSMQLQQAITSTSTYTVIASWIALLQLHSSRSHDDVAVVKQKILSDSCTKLCRQVILINYDTIQSEHMPDQSSAVENAVSIHLEHQYYGLLLFLFYHKHTQEYALTHDISMAIC